MVTADRENLEERVKEINEIFENLNLSVQEELEENLKMMVNRYLLHDCFVDYRSLTHKCVPDWILRARGLKQREGHEVGSDFVFNEKIINALIFILC